MLIRFQGILDNFRYIGNRQKTTRCQFAHSFELETGNWQQYANSIVDGLRRLKLNRQPDINLLSLMIWQLATGSQMPIRFERVETIKA